MGAWDIMIGVGVGLIVSVFSLYMVHRNRSIPPNSHKWESCSAPGENCAICLANMTNKEMKYLICGHAVHDSCYEEMRKHGERKCPICRTEIS